MKTLIAFVIILLCTISSIAHWENTDKKEILIVYNIIIINWQIQIWK